MYAADAESQKRLAKSGETLYLVKDFGITSPNDRMRNVNYSIVTKPKIDIKKLNKNDIVWNYSDINGTRQYDYGKVNITRNLWERDAIHTTSVKAGSPEKLEKSIDIKWFDGKIRKFEFMPPAVSAFLTKTFKDVGGNLELIDKYLPVKGLEFKVEPLKIEGVQYNKEDKNSRLYKIVQKGSVKGKIETTLKETTFTIPALKVLEKIGVAKIGLYAKVKFAVTASGGVERFKYVESNDFKENNPFLELGPSGLLEAGIQAKLLVARNQVDSEVKGYTEGGIVGKIKYNFNKKILIGELYVPPVVLGAKVKIKSKGILKFELIDWKGSVSISDKIPIGSPVEHQF